MTPPYQTVFFDLDGTLLDSIQLIIDSYHHSLATHSLPPKSDAEWLAGIGTPLRIQFGEWAGDPVLFAKLIDTYRDYNIANHDRRVSAYPGAVAMVRTIRRGGLGTGLVTSKQRAGAERGLRFLGLADAMDIIVAADDVVNPKPHPEPLLLATQQLGASIESSLYVGDSLHDMECGRAAGMRTAAVLWGPFERSLLSRAGPDHWLEQPADLLGVLGLAAN